MGLRGFLAAALLICLWSLIQADPKDASTILVSDVAISIWDTDTPDYKTELKFEEKKSVALSANHLQKLKISFKLTTPEGALFSAHQVFFRLRYGKSERLFLFKSSKKGYALQLDFLGLVEELHYLSGQYDMDLIVGDAKMANSFLWNLGSLELDLPEPPEGASKKTPAVETDPMAVFKPKAEIAHIFRTPEKRPPTALSYTFLAFTILPFLAFLVGMRLLNINFGNAPTSGLPALSALAFHGGLASILGLYLLFWLKLNLFTTLQILGFLGLLTTVAGYGILSHLADVSYKVKVA
ncbi:dolichyl-diphosphooligosaccharide--protein glycosyltransferase subunit 2 [Selaginella moellendorffii]|uniref:dolichyl-diphosphooligosaccharide--protein glycosyltransferase subunit 2 n=1 Tax=Selaginella moellendorffii TaxID=88036 RepID=UPI000D1C49CD|nr:dolichyl-diphosphooligosaccharide--protein glycosyltransferase subunit 2 [Selaginella moellendorffii]|eukprot:XP_002967082.2 dolichyl-diphosphooligosaccharide--protein glycosyltransferase subunit 2 [Selaginella moellendorffii]